MSENKQIEELENMVLELLLADKLIIQTLYQSETKMTMSTHVVIRAQDERSSKVRDQFDKYITKYNLDSNARKLRKRFEEIEKL